MPYSCRRERMPCSCRCERMPCSCSCKRVPCSCRNKPVPMPLIRTHELSLWQMNTCLLNACFLLQVYITRIIYPPTDNQSSTSSLTMNFVEVCCTHVPLAHEMFTCAPNHRGRVQGTHIDTHNPVSKFELFYLGNLSKLEFKISITLALILTLSLNANIAGERFFSTTHSAAVRMRSLTEPPESTHKRALFSARINPVAQSNGVLDRSEGRQIHVLVAAGHITSLYHTIPHPRKRCYFK